MKRFGNQLGFIFCANILYALSASAMEDSLLDSWRHLLFIKQASQNQNPLSQFQTKVVFPISEDVIENRSYLPDLGFLTDLVFLFLPRDFAASSVMRLSRDLLESEQCVQYVGCEMTQVSQRYGWLNWIRDFFQDIPFQGDLVERLKQGSMDAITRLNEKKKVSVIEGSDKADRTTKNDICVFSCHPMKSLSRGLKILSLLHDLVRTVK